MYEYTKIYLPSSLLLCLLYPGAGENTLRRLALFVYLDHPTKNDVTSGKKLPRAGKKKLNAAFVFSR